MKPFRWNLRKKEQLGRLLDDGSGYQHIPLKSELVECAAKVLARSAQRRIIFVGRSPENLFDYLSGALEGTSLESGIDLLNISNRFRDIDDIQKELPASYRALKEHFSALGIAPEQILSAERGVCFCDLVAEGGTFGRIFDFIRKWSLLEAQSEFPAIVRKLSFLGITRRTKTSPNTWRWQQHADWVREHNQLTVKNVSISGELWDLLGNQQAKVARTNRPEDWDDEEILLPPRDNLNLIALRYAHEIYSTGKRERKEFAEELARTPEFQETWLRRLVNELKRTV